MMGLGEVTSEKSLLVLLTFLRVLALCLTLPRIIQSGYFVLFRILLSVVVTLAICPLVLMGSRVSLAGTPDWLSLAIGEIGIGLSLGLAASCVILGLQMAGQLVSQLLGFQVGSLQQGRNAEMGTDYRKLFFIMGLLFWLGVSGHRMAIEGLLYTFETLEVGNSHFSAEAMTLVNQLVAVCLEFAVRFSLPVVLVSLVGFLVAGFSSKILGTGQSAANAFCFNQFLLFLIVFPLILVFSEESFRQTAFQLETLLEHLSDWGRR
ncbi:MAG: flagellar biosynthetic protein FliR [Planctomycetota bacterium]|nr:flagellar biosynthetic protein FliR [Planctomycetota bacterium]